MFFLPRDHWAALPLLFSCGFFAYGPQAAFWALCPDLLGRQCAGTGTGVMDFFAYLFAGLGGPMIGHLVDTYDNTGLIFPIVAISCTASAGIGLLIRR